MRMETLLFEAQLQRWDVATLSYLADQHFWVWGLSWEGTELICPSLRPDRISLVPKPPLEEDLGTKLDRTRVARKYILKDVESYANTTIKQLHTIFVNVRMSVVW